MKKICSKGYKISSADQKALDHYLLVTPLKWASDALKGMINKALKTVLRYGFESYKETIEGNISSDGSVIINGILDLGGMKFDKIKTPASVVVKRKEKASMEIWPNGFDLEDYEERALLAIYENPEEMLNWFMENKIYQRRKALIKEKELEYMKEKKTFPANEDDFIDVITSAPGYKNRKTSEKEMMENLWRNRKNI